MLFKISTNVKVIRARMEESVTTETMSTGVIAYRDTMAPIVKQVSKH